MEQYLMLIMYSYDCDYVAVPCNSKEEAEEWRNKYLEDEIKTVKKENGYTPVIEEIEEEDSVKFIYMDEEEYDRGYGDEDFSIYRIIKIGHGHHPELFD